TRIMIKKTIMPFVAAITLAACTAHADVNRYNFTVPISNTPDGSKVVLVDFDLDQPVDSAYVENGRVSFDGTVENPFIGRLIVNGVRGRMFVVERGEITFELKTTSGTPLNDEWTRYRDAYQELGRQYQALPEDADEAQQQAIIDRANALSDSIIAANANNALGAYLFLQEAYNLEPEELNAALERWPKFRDSKRIQKVIETFARKEATAAGQHFTDFTIEHDGKTYKLSDYAGKGTPLLVDFWASWCGPCRRESIVLKDLYSQYHDRGLEILGVAVWDEPENTLEAIEDLQLPWLQIINGQTIPTDLYGILGIPHIMMIDGDGTILFRGLQGDELREAVAQAMGDGVMPIEVPEAEAAE
ncbi:MAG: AhpC/TSA family protein, partial [Muribaculaceae bacterium]|nr:AhpC/TSA family protein [Muribaculaceae bacterium]